MIQLNGLIITPTMFPDGTSQIWKFNDDYINDVNVIYWEFEHEGELMHVAQLKILMDRYETTTDLEIPFLPYGRQDKMPMLNKTFALHAFMNLIQKMGFRKIITYDMHNPTFKPYAFKKQHNLPLERWKLENIDIDHFIDPVLAEFQPDVICFPDHGAYNRYAKLFSGYHIVSVHKERDQVTGKITQMELNLDVDVFIEDKRVLVVDDLCDGGGTFCMAADLLKREKAGPLALYTTHGIYSKGLQVLHDAGYESVFNYKGLVNYESHSHITV